MLFVCIFFLIHETGLFKNTNIYYHTIVSVFTYSFNSLHLLFWNFILPLKVSTFSSYFFHYM
uniref:Uncharacterized protein n=1 Tax=Octopus bimaculoides TaxID=37653 RepID=A0A0L8GYV5_OCTBM